MPANAAAMNAMTYPMALLAVTAISIAPTSTIPWIEFAADISCVCRVAGTLLITSKPTQRLSTKMTRSVRSAVDIGVTSSRFGKCGMNNMAVMGDDDTCLEVVGEIDGQLAILDHVQQERADVARVGGRCGRGHRGWQCARADHRDAVLRHHGLAGNRGRHVAAEFTGAHVDHNRPGRHRLE